MQYHYNSAISGWKVAANLCNMLGTTVGGMEMCRQGQGQIPTKCCVITVIPFTSVLQKTPTNSKLHSVHFIDFKRMKDWVSTLLELQVKMEVVQMYLRAEFVPEYLF